MSPLRVVVDSDGGIDDAAALAWLVSQPDVDIAAVTAVGGNCPATQAARNLRVILEALGSPDTPVYVGADQTRDAPAMSRPVLIHGQDGLGNCGYADPALGADAFTPATEVLIREWRRGSHLLTLGPLTNVAEALAVDPAAASLCAGVVSMGGSVRAGGNARPTAEANVAHDPLSAAETFAAPWPVPPLMVGLDVTHQATLREREFVEIAMRRTAAARLLDGPLAFYRRYGGTFCAPGETPCHDLLAAMALVLPDLLETETVPLEVDTGGDAAWGQTVADLRVLSWRERGFLPIRERAEAEPAPVNAGNVSAGNVIAGNDPTSAPPVTVGLGVDIQRFRSEVRQLAGSTL